MYYEVCYISHGSTEVTIYGRKVGSVTVTTRPKLRLLLKINHTKLLDSMVTEYTSSGAQRAFKYKMTTNPIYTFPNTENIYYKLI